MQSIIKGEGGDSDGQYTSSYHVPLCWHSAAPGLKPRSIRLRSSKFSSALLVSLPGSNQRNFDTTSMFSSARQTPPRSVDLGKQDPKSKLLVKNFYREEKFLGVPPSGAGRSIRWGQPMSSSWEEQTPPKHFEESLRNSKMLRNWSDESLKSSSYFQTIFRSVCLGLLIDLLQTAESF